MQRGNTEQIIADFKMDENIPLLGIADIHASPGMPDEYSPRTLLKSAKSVICYGIKVPEGVVYAERDSCWLYYRFWNITYRRLDAMTLKLCSLLEEEGHRAVPVFSCFPFRFSDNKLRGSVPLVYWAELSGIGKIGRNGLLISPLYGARIALGGLITDASLTPTGPGRESACPQGCEECRNACPVGAIDESGIVNHMKCLGHAHASPLMEHLLADPSITKRHSFETLFNLVAVDDHGSYRCFECIKVCPRKEAD